MFRLEVSTNHIHLDAALEASHASLRLASMRERSGASRLRRFAHRCAALTHPPPAAMFAVAGATTTNGSIPEDDALFR